FFSSINSLIEILIHSIQIDHFSYVNNETFQQRYIISDKYWNAISSPIFFYAGNEGDIFTFANNTGFMWDNARSFQALIIFMEHRYYGQSLPFGNDSFTDIDRFGYLTVEQALADYADFITWLKITEPKARNSPVVVIGGSYGGMLAAWFRMKYPHLAIGALAASAPILQLPQIYDCEGFNRIVTEDFTGYSPNCSKSIRNSWAAIRNMAKVEHGMTKLSKIFRLCEELKSDEIDLLIDWLIGIWGNLAMIDYPNKADFLAPLPAYPIKILCQFLENPDEKEERLLESISKAAAIYTNYTGQIQCNNLTDNNDRLGSLSWSFQACTEMILPTCSDGKNDMFEKSSWNYSDYSVDCYNQFKVRTDGLKILTLFGGENIQAASNIIFSNGLRDPWSAGGVLKSISKTLIAITIPGACHHEDLRSEGPNDSKALRSARKKEKMIIYGWLKDYYGNHPASEIEFSKDDKYFFD
ncbi:lysosomal Pro-X carboxypeptidase-like protein, partial [Sarcoptes scabiei]